jgi:hypothetical protein
MQEIENGVAKFMGYNIKISFFGRFRTGSILGEVLKGGVLNRTLYELNCLQSQGNSSAVASISTLLQNTFMFIMVKQYKRAFPYL